MIASQVVASVVGALIVALLFAIWRLTVRGVQVLAHIPERMGNIERAQSRIEAENRRAHSDIWNAINELKSEVRRA